MVDDGMMVLQNCTDLLKAEPGSCSEECITSCLDESEVTDIKVEVDPALLTHPEIKSEHEVSFMYVAISKPLNDQCSHMPTYVKKKNHPCKFVMHI